MLQAQTQAQSVKDSCVRILMVGFHFSGQLPKYDLEKRFGPNLSAGASFTWKTKHNLLFSVEGSYFFGRNVREDVVASIRNENGTITDNEGYPADLRLTERGWNIYGNVGYMISKLGNNPNSGVFFTVGGGWMQHKVNLYDANKKVAAVNGTLKKGYDRLSGGFGLTQFVGYKYISNNRLANCYFGFEFYEGFTQSLRGFNYDTGLEDTQKRFDMLMGFRFGWILPLYKRTKDFYYY
jgi:hypothetical protein